MTSSIIKTFSGEMYIIRDKTPDEVWEMISQQDVIRMPNGDIIRTSGISSVISKESYIFQAEQKTRHKKGQYLRGDSWHDESGEVARSNIGAILGDIKLIESKHDN